MSCAVRTRSLATLALTTWSGQPRSGYPQSPSDSLLGVGPEPGGCHPLSPFLGILCAARARMRAPGHSRVLPE